MPIGGQDCLPIDNSYPRPTPAISQTATGHQLASPVPIRAAAIGSIAPHQHKVLTARALPTFLASVPRGQWLRSVKPASPSAQKRRHHFRSIGPDTLQCRHVSPASPFRSQVFIQIKRAAGVMAPSLISERRLRHRADETTAENLTTNFSAAPVPDVSWLEMRQWHAHGMGRQQGVLRCPISSRRSRARDACVERCNRTAGQIATDWFGPCGNCRPNMGNVGMMSAQKPRMDT